MILYKSKILGSKERGFTVIELLLVIAIFALLASIVILATKSARDKAQTANLLQHSATVKHVLGANIVGEWLFDEGSGTTTVDTSLGGNTMSFVNASWLINGSVSPVLKNAIQCTGATCLQKTLIPIDNPLNLGGGNFTISCWIKDVSCVTANEYLFYYGSTGSLYGLAKNGSNQVYIYVNLSSSTADSSTQLDTTGKWSFVVGTYDYSQKKAVIYINGKKAKPDETVNPASWAKGTSITTANIGLNICANTSFDEVRVYNETLTLAQIQQLYAEETYKRGLTVEK